VLPRCRDVGLGVLAREPLANGYLSGRYKPGARITTVGDWRASHDPGEVDRTLGEVEQLATEEVPEGVPMAQWAIAWCLRNPGVSAVIPGARNAEQLTGNATAAGSDGFL
jgi:myo-inositol catabolism protein IolS